MFPGPINFNTECMLGLNCWALTQIGETSEVVDETSPVSSTCSISSSMFSISSNVLVIRRLRL
ncbi:hypothetical protein HanIR_Chr15g0729301 [Helianthus annuus]|nr:hypothetical protein HanIR_Chr15g0729301 [Helianthus annuus]